MVQWVWERSYRQLHVRLQVAAATVAVAVVAATMAVVAVLALPPPTPKRLCATRCPWRPSRASTRGRMQVGRGRAASGLQGG